MWRGDRTYFLLTRDGEQSVEEPRATDRHQESWST